MTIMAVSSFPDVAEFALLGSPWTQVALAAAFAVALLAAVVTWAEKQVPTAARRGIGVLAWVSAGLVATVMLGFFVGGAWVIFGVLLAHSSVALAALGLLAVRSASSVTSGPAASR
ncbi:hypothetical protein B5D80_09330 [Micromonospora wenchangensis]|uniref:Uncharacterized protein n=1 Tax=Micromonospora wenchangensis TaxID=1185415 RepID=A0A246RPR2_9ACTN|nr:hypothetical protein B5D80_09330 [Micromonospora wenchangensis]